MVARRVDVSALAVGGLGGCWAIVLAIGSLAAMGESRTSQRLEATMRNVWIGIACLIFAVGAAAQDPEPASDEAASWLDVYRADAEDRWEAEIEKLEQLDATEPDPPDAILLLGSSSIRLWEQAPIDLAPYRTIRRGYGGAKYSDLAIYAERLVKPHQYRGVVLFVANDISGSPNDHTPEEVERLVRHVLSVSKTHQPQAPVLIVEITPTPRRYQAWPRIRELNARLREVALTEPNVYFVATAEHFLDADKKPIAKLFRSDDLHQNDDGYALWASLIRRRLDEVFRKLAQHQALPTPHSVDGE